MAWPEKTYSNIDFWKLDVWNDWVVDWVSEKGLKDKAQEYYNKAKQDGISWKALDELWTNLWLLLQSQNINETILKTWYEESRAKIKAEQKQALQEEKLPELAGYFWDSSIINELQAKLKESWLSLISILENYKKFIENSLALPLWSTITQEQHNQMIANIKILILSRLQETWVELEKLKVENWWNLKWYQLDANNKLAVNLKDIREPLLAGALYLLKTSIEDAPESFKTKEEYEKAKERKNYSMSLNSRLIKNTYKLWDQMNSWGMLYEKISLEELEETNLLTEQDKLIEEKMNMWIMWCCLLSVCPWVWEIMDWINISSSEWEFVSILRKAWIIPEWYKISKSMTDTIITTIWLIASIWTLWLAGRAVKIEKLWRVLAGIWWSMDKAKRWLLLLIQWLWDKWRELAKVVWNFFPDLFPELSWGIKKGEVNVPEDSAVAGNASVRTGETWLAWADSLRDLYHSHFSDDIPANLNNPLAWINELWEISYNKKIIEKKYWVKITEEWWKILFDWKSLQHHPKWAEILENLKELKAHEVTHRILESHGITDIKVWDRSFSQEDICSIVDGSRQVWHDFLQVIEWELRKKIWPDFSLLKDGVIDPDFIRRFDTKNLAKWGDFSRTEAIAKESSQFALSQLPKRDPINLGAVDSVTLRLWGVQNDMLQILRTSSLPPRMWKFNTPYVIIQPILFAESKWKSGYKWLREGENVMIGRNNDRFNFSSSVSSNHVNIGLNNWKINVTDQGSTNGTFMFWYGNNSDNLPERPVQTPVEKKTPASTPTPPKEIQWTNAMRTINSVELADFQRLASPEIKAFLRETNLSVQNKAILNGQEFLLSEKIYQGEGKDKRKVMIWFVKRWDKYEPRFFYFSLSWWNWHCAPWFDQKDGRFSKGEFCDLSYEKGTVVDWKLQTMFSSMEQSLANSDVSTRFQKYFWGFSESSYQNESLLNPAQRQFKNENSVDKVWKNKDSTGQSITMFSYINKKETLAWINNIIRNADVRPFDLRLFKKIGIGNERHTHTHLGDIELNRYQTSLNWKPVEITYANTTKEPWLVWVENIHFQTTRMNSFGLPEKSVNAWLLTTKPLEYADSVPDSIKSRSTIYWGEYVDIRQFIQDNPLIRKFKSVR